LQTLSKHQHVKEGFWWVLFLYLHSDNLRLWIQVRDFELDSEGQSTWQEETSRLQRDLDGLRQSLQQWCNAVYGEVYSSDISLGVLCFLFKAAHRVHQDDYTDYQCAMQVFSDWMHVCAIGICTESMLRYGLPPKFQVFPKHFGCSQKAQLCILTCSSGISFPLYLIT
jgi:hypothetical protein